MQSTSDHRLPVRRSPPEADEGGSTVDQSHTAFIGIGSNLENPLAQCRRAIDKIKTIPKTKLVRCSSFYKSEPLVPDGADASKVPWYINAVCEVKTALKPEEFLNELRQIEKREGRVRNQKWEPRVIDLDLLSYDSLQKESENLHLPHPEIEKRRFVLEPLKEIAPDWKHPKLMETASNLAEKIKNNSLVEKIDNPSLRGPEGRSNPDAATGSLPAGRQGHAPSELAMTHEATKSRRFVTIDQ